LMSVSEEAMDSDITLSVGVSAQPGRVRVLAYSIEEPRELRPSRPSFLGHVLPGGRVSSVHQ